MNIKINFPIFYYSLYFIIIYVCIYSGSSIAQVKPALVLTNGLVADQDDACIWVHPGIRNKSAIIASDKTANYLFVYNLKGICKDTVALSQPGNIDVRYNMQIDKNQLDIIGVNDRTNEKIALFTIHPKTYNLTRIDNEEIITGENYGFCLYKSPVTSKFYAFSSDKGGTVKQFELFNTPGNRIAGKLVRTLRLQSQCEGMVADDETALLYIGEEDYGIHKFCAEPDGGLIGEKIISVGQNGLSDDIEGLAISYQPNGEGYLVVSSQGSATFQLYNRAAPHHFVGEFSVEGVTNTDGIDMISTNLGKPLNNGLFVCHNGAGKGPYVQKVVGVKQIAASIPGFKMNNSYWNPRNPSPLFNLNTRNPNATVSETKKQNNYSVPSWPDEVDGTAILARVTVLDWDQVKFEWTGPSEEDYMFYFKGNGNTSEWNYFFKGKNFKTENGFNYTFVNGLLAGEKYKMVVARRFPKETRWEYRSNVVEFTMPEKVILPSAPVLNKPEILSWKRVKLNWTDSDKEFAYLLERKEGSKNHFQCIARLDQNSTSMVNYGLKPGTTYTYRIIALAAEGETVSNEVFVSTPKLTGLPEKLTVSQVAEPFTKTEFTPSVSTVWMAASGATDDSILMNARGFHADRVMPLAKNWPLSYKLRNAGKAIGFALHMDEKDGHHFILENDSVWDKKDCMNDPNLRHVFYNGHANIRIDNAQESYIQDAGGNYQFSQTEGVCFCPYCRYQAYKQGFDLYNKQQHLEFQYKTTVDFYRYQAEKIYRQHTQNMADKGWNYYNVAANVAEFKWDAPYYNRLFMMWDYGIGRLSDDNCRPSVLYSHSLNSKEHNKLKVWQLMHENPTILRAAAATSYAFGTPAYAPWGYGFDTKFTDYADIFGFIKANKQLYDEFEDAAISGYDLPVEKRYGKNIPFWLEGGTGKVCAMLKAKPDQLNENCIIHLIDWAATPQPFLIKLNPENIFGGAHFEAELRMPADYLDEEHLQAEKSGNFSQLSKSIPLNVIQDNMVTIEIPKLTPNGIVVLKKKSIK